MKYLLIIATLLLVGFDGELPKSLERKIDKTISRSFDSDNITMVKVISDDQDENSGGLGTFIYSLHEEAEQIGYIVITSAMGRHEYFDYCVIYNSDFSIRNVEILVYRSDHGYEITNRKWLKQFVGQRGCGLEYSKDIDAISGATYSAGSITADLARLCLLLQKL